MEDVFHKIDKFILEKMSDTRIPSISLGILKDDEIIYMRGYGFRDISKALPSNENTLYGIGSITKSFTALSIMQLEREGKLSVDDPVENYIKDIPKAFQKDVTIHHFLTHSSGIPALAYAEAYIRGMLGIDSKWLPITNIGDLISFMNSAHEWREAEPGKRFFYLNEAYALLGEIISRVSGIPYTKYVKENILTPLEMRRSFFTEEEVSRDGNWAKPYIIDPEGKHIESRFPFGITSDGGLISNIVDLLRYVNMYINKGSLGDTQLIDGEYVDKMEKPYIKFSYELFGGEAYGYGLIITPNFYGYKLVGHSGSLLVHTGYMGYIREKKIGVALLANASGYRLSYIGAYILALMLDKDPMQIHFIRNEEILKRLEGDYHTYMNTMKAKVVKRDSLLYLIMRESAKEVEIPLFPKELTSNYASFTTKVSWREYNVEFIISNNRVDLIFERYKFRKEL